MSRSKNKTEHKGTWPRPSQSSRLNLQLLHRICSGWLFSTLYVARTQRYANFVPFRSFQATVDTFIGCFMDHYTDCTHILFIFLINALSAATTWRISFTRLTMYSCEIWNGLCLHNSFTQVSWLIWNVFLIFIPAVFCGRLTVSIALGKTRPWASLIVAFCSKFSPKSASFAWRTLRWPLGFGDYSSWAWVCKRIDRPHQNGMDYSSLFFSLFMHFVQICSQLCHRVVAWFSNFRVLNAVASGALPLRA